MTNVLILGVGFIGTFLKEFLKTKNYNVIAIQQNIANYTDEKILTHILKTYKFEFVINCCGYTGRPNVDGCERNKNECWFYNVTVGSLIDRLCAQFGKKCIHVSSGCIYTGYDKAFTEEDIPNFGIFNPNSSFYSKSKHAFETVADIKTNAILRIRMPFCMQNLERNYLLKILKYDKLISYNNSLTCVEDFCAFVDKLIQNFVPGIFNVVNPQPMNALEITNLLKKNGKENINWSFVTPSDLDIIAQRSNTCLSTEKINKLNFQLPDTELSLQKCIKAL